MGKTFYKIMIVIFVLLGITLRSVCAKDAPVNEEKKDQFLPPITIKGVIKNISEAKEHISKETYLQIVPATNGKMNLHVVNGSLIFKSALPKIPFPKDGVFVFKNVRNLKLGESYAIVTQMIENSTNSAVWLIMENKPLKLDFPHDFKYGSNKKEIEIDLTNKEIRFSP